MQVERTDFITVPVTDVERSTKFSAETLGLPWINEGSQQWPELQLGENVSLYLMDPTNIGATFQGRLPHGVLPRPRRERADAAPEVRAA